MSEKVTQAADRRRRIADLVLARGEAGYAELAAAFGVSEMTIRRDVEALEDDGVVRRVIGGVIAFNGRTVEPAFANRVLSATAAKAGIAAAAVQMLEPGETVMLDSGSTALAVARALRGAGLGLTIVTPSLPAAMELVEEPDTEVFLSGGRLRPGELSLIGDGAAAFLGRFNLGTYLMGVGGISAARGVSDYHHVEAEVKRSAVAAAGRVVVIADRSKVGAVQPASIAPTAAIDALVTDATQGDPELAALERAGVQVRTVAGAPA